MTPANFVACCVREKKGLLREYTGKGDSAVASGIRALGLTARQRKDLGAVLDGVLTDAFYTILLALDGAASLGGKQVCYSLRDEDGNELTGGDLEAEAWEQFHGHDA